MEGLNAKEMIARVSILMQQYDYIVFAGGLDQGRYRRAKCLGNDSQNADSEATIGLPSFCQWLRSGSVWEG